MARVRGGPGRRLLHGRAPYKRMEVNWKTAPARRHESEEYWASAQRRLGSEMKFINGGQGKTRN